MKKKNQSNLASAKKLRLSRNGTKTWWTQRVSAIALIPLVFWFVLLIIRIVHNDNLFSIARSPFNMLMLVLFIGVGLYHSTLGVIEIIEDYVHSRCVKVIMVILFKFISIFTALLGICAVIMYHFSIFELPQ